jgi:hypothetical protein
MGDLCTIFMGKDTKATVGKHGGIDYFTFINPNEGEIGSAKIYNFDITKDIISITTSDTYSSVITHGNTVITFDGNTLDSITLVGVKTADLSFVNFVAPPA